MKPRYGYYVITDTRVQFQNGSYFSFDEDWIENVRQVLRNPAKYKPYYSKTVAKEIAKLDKGKVMTWQDLYELCEMGTL